MSKTRKVSLRGLRAQLITSGWTATQVVSQIQNSKGQYVGKFTTSGIGVDEHKRRLKAFAKDSIRSIKGAHEK